VSLRVVFRTDASLQIGTGHVMRCLTLAKVLGQRGHRCRFVCRDLTGHLAARIAEAGFEVTLLPAPVGGFTPGMDEPAHAAWAAVPFAKDAAETRAAAREADWLVLDHYAFDQRGEEAARPAGAKLMVIDDLADRLHVADLLLDQNFGRRAADYDGLLPSGAERLIGPRHALLRPAFAARRAVVLAERAARGFRLSDVLVSMGGVDLPNATSRVLAVLAKRPDLSVTVVMGAGAPALGQVRAEAAAMPTPARVLVDVTDMAALMAGADLAIGAAGGTAWERCALGLPSLMAVLADNQAAAAVALDAAGVAIDLGRPEAPDFADRLVAALIRVDDPATMAALSVASARVADGRGADRVADALEHPLALRPATLADAGPIWYWRAALPAKQFRAGPTPPLSAHLDWFQRALADPHRRLYAVGTPAIAHLRLDLAAGGSASVSILLDPTVRGRGMALRLLALLAVLARLDGLSVLTAEVHPSNAASRALFQAAGYAQGPASDGFETFFLCL
jgi:UDP-2,4-diacetamido-2,4,6-trideoxy-beta-L-altropyranose hydrolase